MRRWLIPVTFGLVSLTPAGHDGDVARPLRQLVPVAASESLAVFTADETADRSTLSAAPITVVLIPGSVGSAFAMRHITAALALHNVPTVVIDLLGMGSSPHPADADYSLNRQGTRLRAALDTLKVKKAVVVALSTSATAALHLAAENPERVVAVLSLAGGVVDRQGTRGIRLALALSYLLDNPVGRAIGRRRFEAAMREQSVDATWITRDVMRAYMQPFEDDLRGSLRTLRSMNDAVEPTSIASRLPLVHAPVQLLVGDKPSPSSPTDGQIALLRRSLRHFSVDTVARSGIMLHEERPDDVVAAILSLLQPSRVADRSHRRLESCTSAPEK